MRLFKKTISLFVCFALILSFSAAALCFADDASQTSYVTISSAADLNSLSQKCRLDTWSENTVVTLACDITLSGSFTPIPIFSGTFDGQGHTISGLNVNGSFERAGLFGILTEKAQVKNLYVSGKVSANADTIYAGGITGENRGYIEGCVFSGSVSSYTVTGGIAGFNSGVINGCVNFSEVDVGLRKYSRISLKTLKSTNLKGIVELVTNGTIDSASDRSGGITGENSGSVLSCKNYGLVGEKGKSENVGGIAGLSDGYIALCSNYASIQGKSNVGGIVGQMLPYIKTSYSEDLLSSSKADIDNLLNVVTDVANDVEKAASEIQTSISGMMSTLGTASTDVNGISSAAVSVVNVKLSEVSEITAYANTAVSGINGITAGIDDIGTQVNEGLSDFSTAAEIVKEQVGQEEMDPEKIQEALGKVGSGLGEIMQASEGLNDATTELHNMFTDLSSQGLPEFSSVSPALNSSIQKLTGDLKTLSSQADSLGKNLKNTVSYVTEDVRDITDLAHTVVDQIYSAAYSLSDLSVSTFLYNSSGDTINESEDLSGIVRNCVNTGSIEGNSDVGGIVGSMTYSASLTVDKGEKVEGITLKSLQYRSIVSKSKSYGAVESDSGNAGGIVGNENIGAITECENYSIVSSPDGTNVGGIAGHAHGLIRDCFVRSTLTGSSYVGGISGSGSSKQLIFDESSVIGCFAEVNISGSDRHCGGISGSETGYFLYNYFVGGTLNGIGDYSIEVQAAPITRQSLLEAENCPEEFSWTSAQLNSARGLQGTDSYVHAAGISYPALIAAAVILLLIALIIFVLCKFISLKRRSAVLTASSEDNDSEAAVLSSSEKKSVKTEKTTAKNKATYTPPWKDSGTEV